MALPPIAAPIAAAGMLLRQPQLTAAGAWQLADLQLHGVPLYFRHALVAVQGEGQVQSATIARIDPAGRVIAGTEKDFATDVVCINHGFVAQSELARALGCEYARDETTGTPLLIRNPDGRCKNPHVFVVGDAGGLGGARIAIEQGFLAGIAIANDLGKSTLEDASSITKLEKRLTRNERFQRALWQVFRAPLLTSELATATTLICRCENLDLQTLQKSITDDCHSMAGIKKATRAGMGGCQGRYCSSALFKLSQKHNAAIPGVTIEHFFAPRPPFKLTPVGKLAGQYGRTPDAVDLLGQDSIGQNGPPAKPHK
jgi:NADPH-dependent 2,4-dienoyl-CoA reductase/sulfur reductase-like enzyme